MSWFRYGENFFGQRYLNVGVYDDKERDAVEAEIRKGDYERLIIGSGQFEHLGFLGASAKHIRYLMMQGTVTTSFSGLECLAGLEELDCDVVSETAFPDFGRLQQLRKCFLAWDKRYDAKGYQHALFGLPALADLTLRYWSQPDCAAFAQLPQLQILDLRQGVLASLDGLEHCPMLRSLDISYLPKLTDISRLGELGKLDHLHIESCSKIVDLVPVTKAHGMKHIHIEKVNASFADLAWLGDMPQLERIMLGCDILRIDWAWLFNHPTLRPSHYTQLSFAMRPFRVTS